MDVKELIEKLVDKIQDSDDIKELFEKEPVKAIEKVWGLICRMKSWRRLLMGLRLKSL